MGHPKRIAALLLAVLIAFSSPVRALAEEPESTLNLVQTGENLDGGIEDGLEGGTVEGLEKGPEEEPGGKPDTETEEGPEESSCTCEVPCTERAVNTECPVCGAEGADLSACKGQTEPEESDCTCETLCAEEAVNMECPVCGAEGADLSACEGEPKPEESGCTCETLCAEGAVNTECPVCGVAGADLSACKGGQTEQAQTITITGFDPLPDDVREQHVPAGTKPEELNLPATLGASGYVEAQDSGEPESLTIEKVEWGSDPAYDENAGQGEYIFTAKLPEGYALAEGVSLPQITVMVEPVNLLLANTGGLQVDNGELGTDYRYEDNTLTILSEEELTLSGTTTADRIVIDENVNANITFNGLSIQLSDTDACAFMIPGSASATITLNGDNNTLKSGDYAAGLAVETGGTVTIKGEGALHSTGGRNAAGIGGGHTFNAGTINIESGSITAVGGGDGAAIGGGHANDGMGKQFGLFDAIHITGGVINAETTGNAAAIGTGCWASSEPGEITIENAQVTAKTGGNHKQCAAIGRGISNNDSDYDCRVTIINSVVDAQNVNGNTISGENGTPDIQNSIVRVSKGSESDNAYIVYGQVTLNQNFTLENEETLVVPEGAKLTVGENAALTNNGTIQNAGTISGAVQNDGAIYNKGSITPEPTGSGNVVTIGNDVEYIDLFPVKIGDCGEDCKGHTIKQSSGGTTTNTITVTGGEHTIKIENVNIDTETGNAILLQNNAKVTLTLSGENTLKPGQTYAGICVPEDTELTIDGDGSLDVTGGRNNGGGAAIGGNRAQSVGSIHIAGGKIDAHAQSDGGAGIGWGGWDSELGGSVLISGGYVKSSGGGDEKSFRIDGKVQITGGIVEVQDDKLNDNNADKNDCLVWVHDTATVYGSFTMEADFTLEAGKTLVVSKGANLNMGQNTLTNNGTISNFGSISGEKAIQNNGGVIYNSGTIEPAPQGGEIISGQLINSAPIQIGDCGGSCTGHTIIGNGQETPNTIAVTGGKHTITLENVKIDTQNGNAILLQNGAEVTLILSEDNILKPGGDKAGICVPQGTSLTIDGDGSLDVTGGRNSSSGAAIGGDDFQAVGSIHIAGGRINAHAHGYYSAGIGQCGWGRYGGEITISGGYVMASGGSSNKGSFSIDDNSQIQITGGIVEVQDNKLDNAQKANCVVWVNDTATVYGKFTLDESFTVENGKTLTIPAEAELVIPVGFTLANNGTISNLGTISGEGSIQNTGTINNTGVIADPIAINNDGEIYNSGKLPAKITGNDPIQFSEGEQLINAGSVEIGDCGGSCEGHKIVGNGQETPNTITVTGGPHDITLENVNINVSGTSEACAFDMKGAQVNLTLKGSNTLKSGQFKPAILTGRNGALAIDGSLDDTLTAYGGQEAAGIGGGRNDNDRGTEAHGGSITINGGSITAKALDYGAGIGDGDYGGSTGDGIEGQGSAKIVINGGKIVIERANNDGAGLGYGSDTNANGGSVTITGGEVEIRQTPAICSGNVSITNCTLTLPEGDSSLDGKEMQNSLIQQGDSITVHGKLTLGSDFTVESGKTLTVPAEAELVIPAGFMLTNNGTISNSGTISGTGTIQNNSDLSNSGEIKTSVTIQNNGTIYNSGTLPEGVSGTVHQVPKGAQLINLGPITIGDGCPDPCPGHHIAGAGETANTITVTGGKHTITIEDVDINTGSYGGNAILLQNGAEVVLILSGTNTLQPGQTKAGIAVSEDTTLILSGEGSLDVTGGRGGSGEAGGAGIGADKGKNLGTIIIAGGDIYAHAHDNNGGGAGIGYGGWGGSGGIISITGGHVTASGKGGEGSFGLSDNSQIQITGGVVEVQDDKLDKAQKTNCLVWVGNTATVYGTFTLDRDFTLDAGETLTVPEGATLVLPKDTTLANGGTIYNYGKISETGAIIQNNGTIYNTGIIEPTVNGKQPTLPSTSEIQHELLKQSVEIGKCEPSCPGHIITGNNQQTANTITVTGGEHDITIQNVNISTGGCAFAINGGASVNLTLEGTNTLQSGGYNPGLYVPQGARLVVLGKGNLTATSSGRPGIGGNDIYGGSFGEIIFQGSGTVTANGGSTSPGIGNGYDYPGLSGEFRGNVTIESGTVIVSGNDGAAGIGGRSRGDDYSTIRITGGRVESKNAPAVRSNDVIISDCILTVPEGDTSLSQQNMYNVVVFSGKTATVYGKYTLDTDLTLTADQGLVIPAEAELVIPAGVTLTNRNVIHNEGTISGDGTIDNGSGTIYNEGTIADTVKIQPEGTIETEVQPIRYDISKAPVVIEQCEPFCPGHVITGKSSANTVTVKSGEHDITLEDVTITAKACPFSIEKGASVHLTLEGNNTLKTGWASVGLHVPEGAKLTIRCGVHGDGNCPADGSGCGKLEVAEAAYQCAGIGGSKEESGGDITITGGIVTASGAESGAGIGGGYYGNGGTITITGGTVTAKGGSSAAGIGGGNHGFGGNIRITGGTVLAIGGETAAGIGGGSDENGGTITITGGNVTAHGGSAYGQYSAGDAIGGGGTFGNNPPYSATVNITGGSVKASTINTPPQNSSQQVYLGVVPAIPNVTDVSVDGVPYYVPGNHKDDDKLYLYMTGENHTVTIRTENGQVTTYKNVTYASGGVNGDGAKNGYFNFGSSTTATPGETFGVSFTENKYTVTYGQTVSVSVEVKEKLSAKVWNFLTRSPSAAVMDSVYLAVTRPDEDTPLVAVGPYAAKLGENSYELDISKLDAGKYELKVWYGGSADSKPADADTADLIINPASLNDADVSLKQEQAIYNKQSHQYEVVTRVALNGKTLQRNIDYTVSFTRNGQSTDDLTNTGEITVVVTGNGNYKDENSAIFTIQPKELNPTITYVTNTKEYDGTTAAPAGMGIKLDGIEIGDAVSATAEGYAYNSANVPGAAIITATGIALQGKDKGNYTLPERPVIVGGSITKSTSTAAPDKPTAAETTDTSITLKEIPGAEYSRDGNSWQDSPVFTGLIRNTEYTFHARIKETANYSASPASTAAITTGKTSLEGATVTVTGTYTYNGSAQTPAVEVKLSDGTTLVEGTDYVVTAKNNTNAGTATATITAADSGDFTGQAKMQPNFTIQRKPVTVTPDSGQSKAYGQKDPELRYFAEGLVGGEQLTGSLGRVDGEKQGEYNITQGTVTDEANPNYTITFAEGVNFAITPAQVNLTVTTEPTSQKVNKDVTVTVTAVNGEKDLMASGWDQPDGVAVTGPDGAVVSMKPKGNNSREGTYRIPETTPEGPITFTVSVDDSTGNYRNDDNASANITVTPKGAVTVKLEAPANLTYGDGAEIAVSVAKGDEKDPDTLTGTVQFYLDGKDETHKLGEAQDISAPLSITLDRTQLTAGEHTVYAVYSGSDYFAESEVFQKINVEQLALGWDASGLTAYKKQNEDGSARVWGELKVTGVLEGDDVAFQYNREDLSTEDFVSAEPGTSEVSLALAEKDYLTGGHAANYALSPLPKISVSVNPVEYLILVENQSRLEIEHGVSSVAPGLEQVGFDTPEKIIAELSKALLETLGSEENQAFYDVTLQISENGGATWRDAAEAEFPEDGLTITLPYPEGTGRSSHDFAVVHLFENPAGQPTETPAVTKAAGGVQFTVTGLSPIGVSWKAAPSRPGSSGSSGGSSSYREREYDFWMEVKDKIQDAEPGDTVKVNARSYDRMPASVMDALREAEGVTLYITWNGGEDIIIPSAAALNEPLRIYYPLSYLEGIDFKIKGEPYDPSKINPETGGIWEVNAPSDTDAITTPEVTAPERGLAETPEQAQQGIEKTPPGVFEPTAPADASVSVGDSNGVWIVVLAALAAAAAGGILFWKKRQTTEK